MSPSRPVPGDINQLIGDLQSSDAIRQEAAVARLRVLGTRALPRLAAFIESAPPSSARALAIAALDGASDRRVVEIALRCLDAPDADTIISALGVLKGWVAQETGTRLLETIAGIAVDRTRDARVRLAALDALADLPEELVRPIREQAPPPESAGPSPHDPIAAREWVDAHGANVTLGALHDAIAMFREREDRAGTRPNDAEWRRARGAAHRVLAERGSRLAVYDAREALDTSDSPLPPGFLEAIARVGDASCLEPLARAWSAAREAAWRAQLSDAVRQILLREKLGPRSAIVKNIRKKWPGVL